MGCGGYGWYERKFFEPIIWGWNKQWKIGDLNGTIWQDIYSLNDTNSQGVWTPQSLHCVKNLHRQFTTDTIDTFLICDFYDLRFRFYLHFPNFVSFLFLSFISFPLGFCLVFICIWLLSLCWNFTAFAAHEVRLEPNILIHLQSGLLSFLVLPQVY